MKLTKEETIDFIGKKVLLITNNDFTYNCVVLSVGEDYFKIRDKYEVTRFILLEEIKVIEVVNE